MVDPVVAWDKLSNFETAQEIREYLQSEGIKAIKNSRHSCALADWMKQITGVNRVVVNADISVGEKLVPKTWYGEMLITDGSRQKVAFTSEEKVPEYVFPHTKATLDFIRNFDDGEYPELVYKYAV